MNDRGGLPLPVPPYNTSHFVRVAKCKCLRVSKIEIASNQTKNVTQIYSEKILSNFVFHLHSLVSVRTISMESRWAGSPRSLLDTVLTGT
jgi:hypothetical protein